MEVSVTVTPLIRELMLPLIQKADPYTTHAVCMGPLLKQSKEVNEKLN